MYTSPLEAGLTYRLKIDFEVREERTGTIRGLLRKGSHLKVRRLAAEEDRVWVEGVDLPLPLSALSRQVQRVS